MPGAPSKSGTGREAAAAGNSSVSPDTGLETPQGRRGAGLGNQLSSCRCPGDPKSPSSPARPRWAGFPLGSTPSQGLAHVSQDVLFQVDPATGGRKVFLFQIKKRIFKKSFSPLQIRKEFYVLLSPTAFAFANLLCDLK